MAEARLAPTSSTRRCRRGRSTPPTWPCGRWAGSWIPVRRDWRLNERHYGDLTGRNKSETRRALRRRPGKVWRRSYDVAAAADRRRTTPTTPTATTLRPGASPTTLPAHRVPEGRRGAAAPLLVRRRSSPDLRAGLTVLVGAHGNSLRALVKHLDGISDADIVELNIPTGVPLVLRARRRPPARRRQAGGGALPPQRRGDQDGGRGRGSPSGGRPGGRMTRQPEEAVWRDDR